MPSLEIHRGGARKLYQILESELVIGSAADATIRVGGGDHHAVIRGEVDAGFRLVVDAGEVELNGKPVRESRLTHGDAVGVGDSLIVFLEDGQPKPIVPRKLRERAAAASAPASAPEPPPAAEPEPPAPAKKPSGGIVVDSIRSVPTRAAKPAEERQPRQPRRSTSSRGTPPWAVMSLAVLGGVVTILVLVKILSASSGRDPGSLLNLAEHKLKRGEVSVARSYVDQAEQGNPDVATQRRIREIRARIDRVARRSADLNAIAAAGRGYNHLQRVKETYLDGKPMRRAAAREFVREADEWLAEHRDVCSRYDEERALVDTVVSWRSTYAAPAALGEPDNADDVVFAASRLVWPKYKRDYRGALAKLDAWLAANPDSPDAARVREQRETWVVDSGPFFEKACGAIDRLIRADRVGMALDRIRYLEARSLPGWADAARAKLAEVEALSR